MDSRLEVVYITHAGEEITLSADIIHRDFISDDVFLTQPEIMHFIEICKANKLNPYLKEAYIVKRQGEEARVITDYKILQQNANRSGYWNGIEQGIVVLTKNGEIIERNGQVKANTDELIGGWARVYRKDMEVPFFVSVNYDEFEGQGPDGEPNMQWKTKPCFMIEKVAKAQALRVAFPEETQGLYVSEEMQTPSTYTGGKSERKIITEEPKEIEQEEIKTIEPQGEPQEEAMQIEEKDLTEVFEEVSFEDL